MSEEKHNNLVPVEITAESLKTKIYVVRGQQVMLDMDLAEIYGYTTKTFNQQVKNNIVRFPEDFRFQLTKGEADELSRSKNLTSMQTAGIKGGRVYLPYAFTEQGIYMLMSVLKGDLATRQSIALVRLFKAMKDYIQNDPLLIESTNLARLSLQVSDNAKDISKIKETMVTKDDLSKIIQSFSLPDKGLEYVIYAGQTFEADAAYADIYSKAKQKLYVVDNYIGPKTLLMLKSIPANVDIIVFSDNIKNMLR